MAKRFQGIALRCLPRMLLALPLLSWCVFVAENQLKNQAEFSRKIEFTTETARLKLPAENPLAPPTAEAELEDEKSPTCSGEQRKSLHQCSNENNETENSIVSAGELENPNDKDLRLDSGALDNGCTVYVAESTIPGAGLGTFTAVPRKIGDALGPSDLCIPLLQLSWQIPRAIETRDVFHDYVWSGFPMGMFRENVDGKSVSAFCPGLGSVVNSHVALVNARRALPRYQNNNGDYSGGNTPYHGAVSETLRNLPAGAELFKYYGERWFKTRTMAMGAIPLIDDYLDAEDAIKSFSRVVSNQPDGLQQDLYQLVLSLQKSYNNSRVLTAFPKSLERARVVARESISAAYQLDHMRSTDWLKTHGRCADNIVPGNSTLDSSMQGAFAARDLSQGQVITASPLFHIPSINHDFMDMLKVQHEPKRNANVRHLDSVVGQQLVLNYCFGHNESTLLLCPYGAGVNFINHGSSTEEDTQITGQKGEANVKIQWAETFSAHLHSFVEKSPLEALDAIYDPVLAFEYVALRDIQKGEELLLDYGPDWVQAYNYFEKHLGEEKRNNTKPDERRANTMLATKPLRTKKEMAGKPYPSNLEIRCHAHVILDHSPTNFTWEDDMFGHPCRVEERYESDTGEQLYLVDVEVWPYPYSPTTSSHHDVTRMLRARIPRHALRFFDKPGSTFLHSRDAFRHRIGIPNHMFPEKWRNMKPRRTD